MVEVGTVSEYVECFERARDAWSNELASSELQSVSRALEVAGVNVAECVREAARITESPSTRQRLEAFRRVVARSTPGLAAGAFERFVLGSATLQYGGELQSAAVPPIVTRLTCQGLLRIADDRATLDVAEDRFVALCKMATLRRFAAGQFDWEHSGLPRSWLFRVRPLSALFRLLSMLAFEWRGVSPAFFVHLPIAYPVHALFEREALKSYHRMAQSMELQPEVKGLIASSWLHSPATFEISPHLAWLNKAFAAHGAFMATMGPAPPDCGVLAQSVERQRAFSEGRFKPTLGLIVWARRDVLLWAAAHPELDS
jgi:hypothetical protein